MIPERRKFLLETLRGFGLAAAEGLARSDFMEEDKSAPLILRPPGVFKEKEFPASCTSNDVTEDMTTQTPRSSKKPEDYLNEEKF
ncbi:MAG: hypothetical protein HZC48_02930 [Nitrospirae bacterium]|nr:hypothetical protein [Nitrospirota bacterium]